MNKPEITRHGLMDLQVCVPKDYTDQQVEEFANEAAPTFISSKWTMKKADDPTLGGDPVRQQCLSREDCCHIMLSC